MSSATVVNHDNAATAAEEESSVQPLTHELFIHHMKAMAIHYKSGTSTSGPTHVYALPIALLHPVGPDGAMHLVATPSPDGKAAMDSALQDGKSKLNGFAKNQTDFVNQQAQKLQGNKDTAGFAAQMNAQRTKAKQEADQHIDDMYNKLIDVGTKHPQLQSTILSVTQKLGAFITGLLSSVMQFFTKIFSQIVQWVSKAVDWVKGAAETAGKWLAGASGSIGSFFSSIF